MLSVNSKRQLFKPQRPKKGLIAAVIAVVIVSFTSGMLFYINSEGKTVTSNDVQYVNSGTNKVEVDKIVDKPQVNETKQEEKPEPSTVDNGGSVPIPEKEPLKDYEVPVEEVYKKDGVKNAYLTFDDGPTKNITPQVLDFLKENNIKASFFVMGQMSDKNPDMLKRAYDEGHAICMHSYYHDYKSMYNSPEFFKDDLALTVSTLKKILGQDFSTRVYRFPGGSAGKGKEVYRELLKEAGFYSLDWNALTGDSETIKEEGKKRTRNAKEQVERLKQSIVQTGNPEDIVILMHDAAAKQSTVEALPEIIEYLKTQGYNFKTIK